MGYLTVDDIGLGLTKGALVSSIGALTTVAIRAAQEQLPQVLEREKIDGTVGAVFQKGLSLLNSIPRDKLEFAFKVSVFVTGVFLVGSLVDLALFSIKGTKPTMDQLLKKDDLQGLKKYLSENPHAINKVEYGKQPIHLAAEKGASRCLQYLLEQGADVNALAFEKTALELAMKEKHSEVVEMLKKDSNLDLTQTIRGDTVLHRNVSRNTKIAPEIIALENNGIDLPNNIGNTALHIAVDEGFTDLARALLEKGARIALPNNRGDTPMHRAARNDNKEMIQLLPPNVIGIDLPNNIGNTALHIAVDEGFIDVARALLEKGARVALPDKYGRTPMHLAAKKANKGMIQLLWEFGASFDKKDRYGKTPLAVARKTASEEITKLQALDLKEPWTEVKFYQRGENGKVMTDGKKIPIVFQYMLDKQTFDLYEIESSWKLRTKALLTFLATPYYLPMNLCKQLAGIVLDIRNISVNTLYYAVEQIKIGGRFIQAITIDPINDLVCAIALRIWKIVSSPFYVLSMLFAALYTQINQLKGRKMMNKMADDWSQKGFLRFMGLANVGNARDGERKRLAQFITVDLTPKR